MFISGWENYYERMNHGVWQNLNWPNDSWQCECDWIRICPGIPFRTIKNLMMMYYFVIWSVPLSFFKSRTCSRTLNSDRHFPVPLYFPYRYGIAVPYLKFGPRANPAFPFYFDQQCSFFSFHEPVSSFVGYQLSRQISHRIFLKFGKKLTNIADSELSKVME